MNRFGGVNLLMALKSASIALVHLYFVCLCVCAFKLSFVLFVVNTRLAGI